MRGAEHSRFTLSRDQGAPKPRALPRTLDSEGRSHSGEGLRVPADRGEVLGLRRGQVTLKTPLEAQAPTLPQGNPLASSEMPPCSECPPISGLSSTQGS